jgi:hemerythrin
MALHWSSALAVGVPEIDLQHEEMFARVDRLHDAMLARDRTEVVRMLRFLVDYVHHHLGAEEALMESVRYPELDRHRRSHQAFKGEVESLARKVEAEGVSALVVHRVEREVSSWLHDHVFGADVEFVSHLRMHRAEESARRAPISDGDGPPVPSPAQRG